MIKLVIILAASIFGAAGINYILNTIAIKKRRRINLEDYIEVNDPILEECNTPVEEPIIDTEESSETTPSKAS